MSTRKSSGFTIIEVVLVLAIAALIFLMVFVAVPTMNRNQRNNERKTDAGLVSTAVSDFASAKRRTLKASDAATLQGFVEKLNQYDVANISVDSDKDKRPGDEQVLVIVGQKCDGDTPIKGTSRQAVVMVKLEGGPAAGSFYCVDASS